MKNWFMNLEARERNFVLFGASALLLLLLYLGVWQPLVGGHQRLENSVEKQQETLQWMLASSAEVRTLQGGQKKTMGLGGRSLLAVVDNSARKAGLGPALKRVEPEGNDKVKVWLEEASFDGIIRWLGRLSDSQGVKIDSISMEKKEIDGQVNSRVTLLGPPTNK